MPAVLKMKSARPKKDWPHLRKKLAAWYATAARALPWRQTSDPYAIAVSEIMLQQTQVATVVPYYSRWMKLFPTWRALAEAPENTILKAWEGLGYYRRARNLHALAKAVVRDGGALPRDEGGLRSLPGIGPYTAAAIGSIAYGLPLAVLDGNVMRVLARLFALEHDIALARTRFLFQTLANEFLDRENPSIHNQALMELGATVCLPRKPLCLFCPLGPDCAGRSRAGEFPVKSRTASVPQTETVAIIKRGKSFYCEQVPEGKPWHGLWRFPDFDSARMERGEKVGRIKYGITKYSVTMEAVEAKWKTRASVPGRHLTSKEMEALAFAAPHRKLIRFILQVI
ncbi:MAG TPA: A/G-specific adenine glycosylase [Candidatus Methylacidiphilales bacterium]|nr:A/G-specific adenine glycosylase [Candidatus Methylacidiphilales bacterium]